MRVIRKQLIRRSLEMIEGLAKKEGGEDYKTFWENFGRNLKVCVCVVFGCVCRGGCFVCCVGEEGRAWRGGELLAV